MTSEEGTWNERATWNLFKATMTGSLTDAKAAIDQGADVNARTASLSTGLHLAVSNGHIEIAKLLIEKGATLNVRDKWQQTPLDRAKASGSREMVEMLEAAARKGHADRVSQRRGGGAFPQF